LVFPPAGHRHRHRLRGVALALALAVGGAITGAAAEPVTAPCPSARPDLLAGGSPLPRTASRLAGGETLRIVTLGSSSTAGAGASSPDHAYPCRLETLLRDRRPGSPIEVINSGINGQLTADMVERLYRDAIEAEADLVIWQTGTNDALSRVDLDDFREQLERGADWLAQAGIDLILVDPQYFPGVRNPAAYERYVEVMAEVGAAHGVTVFPRYAIMRQWAANRSGPAVLADDHFHMNDQGYGCIAELLSETILRLSHP